MEMFNVHRRDVHSFDDYMNLKKPGFGGPSSAKALRGSNGKRIEKDYKLKGYQRTVERDPTFSNQVFNPTYKAMGGDLVHKQEVKKNPYNYPDPYSSMGIPVVEVGETNEGKCNSSFISFMLNESDANAKSKGHKCECEGECECETPKKKKTK
jgi:hypothetical protein